MRPSNLFHLPLSLPFLSSSVAPWPQLSSFDKWLSEELHDLKTGAHYMSIKWLAAALDSAIAAQKQATQMIAVGAHSSDQELINPRVMEEYLHDVIELLDACHYLQEQVESITKYKKLLALATHCLEGAQPPCNAALARARLILASCKRMEEGRSASNLKLNKMGEKRAAYLHNGEATEEALSGSKAVALLACRTLSVALSFKSDRHFPRASSSRKAPYWFASLHELEKQVKEDMGKMAKGVPVLQELRQVVLGARNLRSVISQPLENDDELRESVESLGRWCGELEEGIKMLEKRVPHLYNHLISIRMALLATLSGII